MQMLEMLDNVSKTVKDDLTVTIKKGDRLSIAAACFSIYAYQALKKQLDGFADNIKEDRTDEDLLFQVMLDLGIPLSVKITQSGNVFTLDDNYLVACFKQVDTALITEIAQRKPYYAVFRDSSFGSDSAMVNFEQVFNTYSPQTIRRVL